LARDTQGSHFHRGDVSLSPPIMPYGRISQVRFEALACHQSAFPNRHEVQALARIRPACEWFAHDFVPVPGYGLVCPVLSGRARARRRNRQVPRVPLPDVGVTFIREPCTGSCEDITPRSSLLQTHSPILCGSPLLRRLASLEKSSQVAAHPLLPPGPSRRYSANLSCDA